MVSKQDKIFHSIIAIAATSFYKFKNEICSSYQIINSSFNYKGFLISSKVIVCQKQLFMKFRMNIYESMNIMNLHQVEKRMIMVFLTWVYFKILQNHIYGCEG